MGKRVKSLKPTGLYAHRYHHNGPVRFQFRSRHLKKLALVKKVEKYKLKEEFTIMEEEKKEEGTSATPPNDEGDQSEGVNTSGNATPPDEAKAE